ncbi:MAG TPA: S1 family peptidase [Solirubrobacteraceae bacterium]|jgi:hypothetical protein
MHSRALSAVLVALVATLAASPSAFGDALAEDALTVARQKGGSVAAVERRLRTQDAGGGVGGEAQRRWPQTYAGSWREDDGTLVAAFTRDAARSAAALGRGVRGVVATRSMAELERRRDRMVDDRELAKDGFLFLPGAAGGRYDLEIDERGNRLVVTLEDGSPGAAAAFRARYGDDVLVRSGPLAAPDCSRADCRYGLRSGLSLNGAYCSSAFTVKRWDNGNRNLLSAAHCEGTNRYHGGQKYGDVQVQQLAGRVDAERHSTHENGFYAEPWIYVDAEFKHREVHTRGDYEGLTVGDLLCKSGVTTDRTCGEVLGKHFSPGYITGGFDFVKTSYCADGGDSGGGVYAGNKAIGVHSGGTDGPCSQAGDFSIFGHVEYVQQALQATVVVAGS